MPTSSAARSSVRTELAARQPTSALPQARLISSTRPIKTMSRTRSGMIRFPIPVACTDCVPGSEFGKHSLENREVVP